MIAKKHWFLIAYMFIVGSTPLFSQTREIAYFDWERECDFKSRPRRFIINSQAEFKEMSDCLLFNFDFENYTIVGAQGISPGHFKPIVDIRIFENTVEKKVSIEVTISGGKACACRVMKPSYKRIIYTDQLKSDFEIEFKYIFLEG